MTFSQYAGVAIVPTLARLVLAAVFISVGWNKVFKQADFTAEQATTLKGLGVNADPVASPSVHRSNAEMVVIPASLRQEATPPPPVEPPPADEPVDDDVAGQPTTQTAGSDDQATPAQTTTPPQVEPLPAGTYRATALHQLSLMLHENNFPQPVWMARLAAFTELIGGAMILLGLFSRIWGLGLAITMGVAFYLVSMKVNGVFTVDPRTFAENHEAFSTATVQLGLFVLAFGIFLTGPGPISLDRLLFGRTGDELESGTKID